MLSYTNGRDGSSNRMSSGVAFGGSSGVASNGRYGINLQNQQHPAMRPTPPPVNTNPFAPLARQQQQGQQQQASNSSYGAVAAALDPFASVGQTPNTTAATTSFASPATANVQTHPQHVAASTATSPTMSPTTAAATNVLAKAASNTVHHPNPPGTFLAQKDLIQAFQQWIWNGERAMGSYRIRIQEWCTKEKQACDADVSTFQQQIDALQSKIRERKEATSKKMEPVLAQANAWVAKQGQRLSDAKRTMEVLTRSGAGTTNPPNELICPITLELMQDPVIAADGHTYERSAIEQVFSRAASRHRPPVSPCTNLPLESSNLIPNVGIRSLCRRWEEENSKEKDATRDDASLSSTSELSSSSSTLLPQQNQTGSF